MPLRLGPRLISGWSKIHNHYYYICLGVQAGDKVGELIMSRFEKFLAQHLQPLTIYFVGAENINKKKSYSPSMFFNNHQAIRAGPHCMSYELKQSAVK